MINIEKKLAEIRPLLEQRYGMLNGNSAKFMDHAIHMLTGNPTEVSPDELAKLIGKIILADVKEELEKLEERRFERTTPEQNEYLRKQIDG